MKHRTPAGRGTALLLLGLGLSLGCAARQPVAGPGRGASDHFDEAERALLLAGSAEQRFAMVTNDGAAGDALLRRSALPIHPAAPELPQLLERMRVTLVDEGGVGIAAPQIGIARRVIWVKRLDKEGEPLEAYLNPRIIARSDETVVDWEGCLSIPAGFGQVRRAETIEITYDRPDGSAWETVSGFTARIFQHEVDHLDGVLFIDVKEPGALLPEAEYRKLREQQKAAEAAGPTA